MALFVKAPPVPKREPEPVAVTELRLSQSLIKAIGNGEMCPRFYYEYHLTRQHQLPPTEPQKLGQYFEWLAIGNLPKDGKVVMPDTGKRGAKSADTLRVEKQASRVRSVIQQYGLSIIIPDGYDSPATTLTCALPNYPHIMFEGTLDLMASNASGGVYTIIDLKATSSLEAKYMGNRPGWGDYMNMDHTQAAAYLWLCQQNFPKAEFEFMYFVFAYGTRMNYKPIRIRFNSMRQREFLQAAHNAAFQLETWQEQQWPTAGHPSVCLRCHHRATCPSAQLIPPIEDFDGN